MEQIDQELARLQKRMDELEERVIPEFENKAEQLYVQIMLLKEGSPERHGMEAEYKVLSNDIRMRSQERLNLRQEIDNLTLEKNTSRR